jgi:hypothetical protein
MAKDFNVYKWKRDYFLNEDLNKYQEYPKNKIGDFEYAFLPKKQFGGGVELYKTSEVNFDLIPNEITFTGEQYSAEAKKNVPIFLFKWTDYERPKIDPTGGLTSDEYNKTSRRYQGD